jgi:hypothetical protein
MWPGFFLLVAFWAILVMLLAAFVATATDDSVDLFTWTAKRALQLTATAITTPQALAALAPIYAVIFGYSLLSLIVCMVGNVKLVLIQAVMFVVFVPDIAAWYRNYLTISSIITWAILASSSIWALFSALSERVITRSETGSPMGSDTFSHLLYYFALLSLLAAGAFCNNIVDFVECLALGFIAACMASYGIVVETNAFSRLIANSGGMMLANAVRSMRRRWRRND